MRAPKARSYGAQPPVRRRRRDRMEHAPACTIGQVLLLVYYKYSAIYIYKKTYQLFQVIARTKLVSFTILAALILYNNLIIIPEATLFQ